MRHEAYASLAVGCATSQTRATEVNDESEKRATQCGSETGERPGTDEGYEVVACGTRVLTRVGGSETETRPSRMRGLKAIGGTRDSIDRRKAHAEEQTGRGHKNRPKSLYCQATGKNGRWCRGPGTFQAVGPTRSKGAEETLGFSHFVSCCGPSMACTG
ncbi:hypothetical protein CONLIGDRAFT_168700 [Coniochaeta ligniaria NRRL 30616]|uniref:Uncharacterized protein n=1 Tax=Coniochaeta ligniaria NRRL 30616 TaxID=1408157 RepID=A0A1J7J0N0_9PEZI|nr:hypothetical protein CONLIGDRAFT_168700 [Coniochaeta ligniaria NRRL 30616]